LAQVGWCCSIMAVHYWMRWRTQMRRENKPKGLPVKYGRANRITTRARSALAIVLKPRGISRDGPTLACNSTRDWLLPHCTKYHGMHVSRTPTWGEVQHHVDSLASYGVLGSRRPYTKMSNLRTMRIQINRLKPVFQTVFSNWLHHC